MLLLIPDLCEHKMAKDRETAVFQSVENESIVVIVDRPALQLHQVVDQLPSQLRSQGWNFHPWVVFPSPAAATVLRDGDYELAVRRQLSGEPAELRIDLVNSVKEEVDGVLGGGVPQQLLQVDEERSLLGRNTLGWHIEVVRELKANGSKELDDRVAVWSRSTEPDHQHRGGGRPHSLNEPGSLGKQSCLARPALPVKNERGVYVALDVSTQPT